MATTAEGKCGQARTVDSEKGRENLRTVLRNGGVQVIAVQGSKAE